MTQYKYICLKHKLWVDTHPREAFGSVQQMTKLAEHSALVINPICSHASSLL
jgi:hypothetical protein